MEVKTAIQLNDDPPSKRKKLKPPRKRNYIQPPHHPGAAGGVSVGGERGAVDD